MDALEYFKEQEKTAEIVSKRKRPYYSIIGLEALGFSYTEALRLYVPVKQGKKTVKSSKYKGVSFDKNANKWKAYIWSIDKPIHLGLFKSEIEAYEAYKQALKNKSW
jgi:hypothetical protein